MAVKRVVANIATPDPARAAAFYGELLGMPVVMDHGWIVTHGGQSSAVAQVSFASEGGSGTPVPDLSIEVDNLQDVLQRMRALPASRWNMALLTNPGACGASSSAIRSVGC